MKNKVKRPQEKKAMKVTKIVQIKTDFEPLISGIIQLLDEARHFSARAVNSIMTATYWEVGRRIVEYEQRGERRAGYGEMVMKRLAIELTSRFGKGFSLSNIKQMKKFHLLYHSDKKENLNNLQKGRTVSGFSDLGLLNTIGQTMSGLSPIVETLKGISSRFKLSWSHYVSLLGVRNDFARKFYETEALRGGWSIRQLNRQINSQFYERTALSRKKAAMLTKGSKPLPTDLVTPEEEIKSPYLLEFLGLKDEYSETQLEEALINHLGAFLLELGRDFAFIARQKRLRIDDSWYRVDLVFFHRKLRSLLLIDLKMGEFSHADAGQMHLYLNYARENWTNPGENPPVGLILCAKKSENVVKYALDNLPNKVIASEYMTELPKEKTIAEELEKTQRMLENRRSLARIPLFIKKRKEKKTR
jgi:predicted nuclease of restriction endonuclease-like (RecB) superfamily